MAISKIPSAGFQDNVKFKNLIINGGMDLAQRGTTFTGNTASNYMVDRFTQSINGAMGTWTNGQSTEVPTAQGFSKSLIMDCTTADASPATADFVRVQQHIEGQNLQYLKKGTANAESLTASFWVKSNKTGTYIAELEDRDNTRYVSQSYTISSANTWEKKTVTFPGDTTGAFDNDNAESLRLNFWLGGGATWTSGTLSTTWHTTNANRAVGQVNLADSTSNEWYITGVQLEAGTSASDFEFLPVDVNLNRCLRYYYHVAEGTNKHISIGAMYTSSYLVAEIQFPVLMRTAPSLIQVTGTDYYVFYRNGSSDKFDQFNAAGARATKKALNLESSSNLSGTAGNGGTLSTQNASAKLAVNAEL